VTPDWRLGLIDFSDMHIYPRSLGKYLRARNMRRMNKAPGVPGEANWVGMASAIAGKWPTDEWETR
jgi:hypothetical protein